MGKVDQPLIKAVGKNNTEEYNDGENTEHKMCGWWGVAEEGSLAEGPGPIQKTLHSVAVICGVGEAEPYFKLSCN